MKITNLFNVFALILIITFVSCDTLVISYDVAFTELNRIVQSSAYAEKFSGKKHYTVLAPLNGAFTKLPKGTVEKLVATENIAELNAIMNCHIIPGLISEKDIIKAIKERNGSVKLKTLGGTRLIATRKGGKIYLIDKNGNAGRLMKTDIEATNGIIHTLETVMLPKR